MAVLSRVKDQTSYINRIVNTLRRN